MASAKRFCDGTTDRITELPRDVIDCILERMSIRDAARTSILSRKWRYIWASVPQLVFDEYFFKEINRKHKRFVHYEFPKAIYKVFMVHSDPILKFLLHIPTTSLDLTSDIDNWMLSLSRNGIKKLQLKNANLNPYIVPSCIFSCDTLKVLKLTDCTLNPPIAFEGFCYLVKLELENVSFPTNMSTKILHNAPMLRKLSLWHCKGIELRNINAPNLNYFATIKSENVDWQWFERSQQIEIFQVELCNRVKNYERTVNVMIFLKNMPRLRALWLNGFSLKVFAPDCPPQSFPTSGHRVLALSLMEICLTDFGVDDIDQISSAFCLLRSCPNLKLLDIDFATIEENVTESFLSYLEPSNHKHMKLEQLETVSIRFVTGYKAQLLFIKLLLVCSTYLQRMTIEPSNSIGVIDLLKISRELLRCSRASSRAEIIYVESSYL